MIRYSSLSVCVRLAKDFGSLEDTDRVESRGALSERITPRADTACYVCAAHLPRTSSSYDSSYECSRLSACKAAV